MTCNWYRWVSCFKDWYAVLLQSQLIFKMGIRLLQRTLKKYAFKKINFVYLLQGSWKLIRCLGRETRELYSSKWFKRQMKPMTVSLVVIYLSVVPKLSILYLAVCFADLDNFTRHVGFAFPARGGGGGLMPICSNFSMQTQ